MKKSNVVDDIRTAIGDEYNVVDLTGPDAIRKDPIWTCKIGIIGKVILVAGADLPMRRAVERAFFDVTGIHAEFIFSGWGGTLTDTERDVVKPTAGTKR